MPHRRAIAILAVVGALLAACAITPPGTQPHPAGTGTVAVTIRGMAHDRGQVLVSLFRSAAGFPGDPRAACATAVASIRDGRAAVRFAAVPAGPVAVSAFHDEQGNRELDTGLLGVPTERWGVSRGARGLMGPPSFRGARLELRADEVLEIEVEVE